MRSVRIYLFGKFEIWVDDHRVDEKVSKSRKNSALIQYLILHRSECVQYSELYDVLWPNGENTNPESSLKTMISRLRSDFSKISKPLADCIGTRHGSYIWNENSDVLVDVYEFEDLCALLSGIKIVRESDENNFKRLYHLYHGNISYSASEDNWLIKKNLYYRNLYKLYVNKHVDFLCSTDQFEKAISACKAALEIDPFDEQLHMQLMNAQVKSGRKHDALLQYEHISNLSAHYLGTVPSDGLQDFYKAISSHGRQLDDDIDVIHTELQNFGETKGAFVCEYSVFKEIYNLQLRAIRRNHGYNIFLVLIMLSPVDKVDNSGNHLISDEMQILLNVMKKCLRKSDTVSRYSPTLYVV
ncbi:MAG: hypothetical protein CW338_08675, partial [Clostridiales bacterium]|nr:hypothetical protein [Clostridiales bacterium]